MPLRIAAKLERNDWRYFKETIEPLLKDPAIEFVGEIGDAEKNAFLGNARALLFPINWPEPFGLVMIESLACGTPVIAYPCGSVPEVMRDGVSGFVVRTVEEAASAVEQVGGLSRRRCRDYFEARFSAARMARDYVAIYERMIEERKAVASFSPRSTAPWTKKPRRASSPARYLRT
jgi:glycosyltransferase involved in cell wall biosynthesis